jgi:hypothetical protein
MENFEKLMKAFHRVTGESITIKYNGASFDTCVGEQNSFVKWRDYESMSVGLKDEMVSRIMNLDVKLDIAKTQKIEVLVKKENVKGQEDKAPMKTRQEWSFGKEGDPRKGAVKGRGRKRKRKSFSKTQIVQFMRRNSNFTSEQVTYAQYCKEFMHEHRKAENRQWWRENRGKGLENYDVTKLHRSVQK